MNQVESAALTLAAAMLAFVALVLAIWWLRRPRTTPAAPRAPRTPGESRLPKLSRKAKVELEPVEISASRLARISGKAPLEQPDVERFDIDPEPAADIEIEIETMVDEAALAAIVADVEDAAHRIERADADAVSLRLVPQIPPRDAILTTSWLGGRPRLPSGAEWPLIDGEPADFLA